MRYPISRPEDIRSSLTLLLGPASPLLQTDALPDCHQVAPVFVLATLGLEPSEYRGAMALSALYELFSLLDADEAIPNYQGRGIVEGFCILAESFVGQATGPLIEAYLWYARGDRVMAINLAHRHMFVAAGILAGRRMAAVYEIANMPADFFVVEDGGAITGVTGEGRDWFSSTLETLGDAGFSTGGLVAFISSVFP